MIERHPVSASLHSIGWPGILGFALAGPGGGIIAAIIAAIVFVAYAAGRL